MTRTSNTVAAAFIACLAAPLSAQAPSWFLPHNQVAPSVTTTVSLDASGDFRYHYTVGNGTGAAQRINKFFLELAVAASATAAPTDWYSIISPKSVTWAPEGAVDPSWTQAHEADIPSFLSEIAAGASLTGFDLVSACGGSSTGLTFYAQGYNHLGKQPDDDTTWVKEPTWREDAVTGTVLGPSDCSAVADWGTRRPGVDGFMGMVNFASGATFAGPATVQIRFSRDGETVNRPTFHAELNSVDVTSQFVQNSRGDLVAVFAPGTTAAKVGKNVLLIKVDGLIAGTTRTATDADRFTFIIQ